MRESALRCDTRTPIAPPLQNGCWRVSPVALTARQYDSQCNEPERRALANVDTVERERALTEHDLTSSKLYDNEQVVKAIMLGDPDAQWPRHTSREEISLVPRLRKAVRNVRGRYKVTGQNDDHDITTLRAVASNIAREKHRSAMSVLSAERREADDAMDAYLRGAKEDKTLAERVRGRARDEEREVEKEIKKLGKEIAACDFAETRERRRSAVREEQIARLRAAIATHESDGSLDAAKSANADIIRVYVEGYATEIEKLEDEERKARCQSRAHAAEAERRRAAMQGLKERLAGAQKEIQERDKELSNIEEKKKDKFAEFDAKAAALQKRSRAFVSALFVDVVLGELRALIREDAARMRQRVIAEFINAIIDRLAPQTVPLLGLGNGTGGRAPHGSPPFAWSKVRATNVCVCVCIYVYIYIYIPACQPTQRPSNAPPQIVDALRRAFPTIVVDEWGTTKYCACATNVIKCKPGKFKTKQRRETHRCPKCRPWKGTKEALEEAVKYAREHAGEAKLRTVEQEKRRMGEEAEEDDKEEDDKEEEERVCDEGGDAMQVDESESRGDKSASERRRASKGKSSKRPRTSKGESSRVEDEAENAMREGEVYSENATSAIACSEEDEYAGGEMSSADEDDEDEAYVPREDKKRARNSRRKQDKSKPAPTGGDQEARGEGKDEDEDGGGGLVSDRDVAAAERIAFCLVVLLLKGRRPAAFVPHNKRSSPKRGDSPARGSADSESRRQAGGADVD